MKSVAGEVQYAKKKVELHMSGVPVDDYKSLVVMPGMSQFNLQA